MADVTEKKWFYIAEEVIDGRCGVTTNFPGSRSNSTCWRESWQDYDRCIWHADMGNKTSQELALARTDQPERIDGAILSDTEINDSIDFTGCKIRYGEFSNAGLQNAEFPEAILRWTDFSNANLSEANFNNSDLRNTDLKEANLQNADLFNANLESSDLTGAVLKDSRLNGSTLYRSKLIQTKLRDADLIDGNCRNANFTEADLWDANFSESNLRYADLVDADLRNANLTDTDLRSASLRGAAINHSEIGNFKYDVGTKFGGRSQWEPRTLFEILFGAPLFISLIRLMIIPFLLVFSSRRVITSPASSRNLHEAELQYRATQAMLRKDNIRRELPELDVRQKDALRRRMLAERKPLRWLALAGARWVTLYGESPWRVVATTLVVIVGCAWWFPRLGGTEPKMTSIWDQLSFSVEAFTTLGYANVEPASEASRHLVAMEGLVGTLLMALLVAVLAHRLTR